MVDHREEHVEAGPHGLFGVALVAGAQDCGELGRGGVEGVMHGRPPEVLLGAEVVADEVVAHPRRAGDLPDRGTLEAPVGERLEGGGEDRGAGAVGVGPGRSPQLADGAVIGHSYKYTGPRRGARSPLCELGEFLCSGRTTTRRARQGSPRTQKGWGSVAQAGVGRGPTVDSTIGMTASIQPS